jgi:hypothetical protein
MSKKVLIFSVVSNMNSVILNPKQNPELLNDIFRQCNVQYFRYDTVILFRNQKNTRAYAYFIAF